MSDKPLSVDEILDLVMRYTIIWARTGSSDPKAHDAWDRLRAELEKLTVVEPVVSGEGEYRSQMYVHVCDHVEWIADRDRAETGGGCDACESGSDDPSDWTPLYRAVKP